MTKAAAPAKHVYSDYDSFAWFYNQYWGPEFSQPALVIYQALVLHELPQGARILDLCCGTGQIAAGLCERGFQVTGLDGSAEMLALARHNAPAAEFLLKDARAFSFAESFDVVLSAFDSLNHVMRLRELTQVFRNVYAALRQGGTFLFDMNMEHEHELLDQSLEMIEDDHVCVARANYNPTTRLKRYDLTMFRLADGIWQRNDLTLQQHYYTEGEIYGALAEAGFTRVTGYDAQREFGLSISDGRMFYLAQK